MSIVLQKWQQWWFAKTTPHILAIARISVGVWALVFWLAFADNIIVLFSTKGIALPLYADKIHNLSWLLEPPIVPVAYAAYIVLILVLIAFTVGAYMRTSTCIILLLSLYFWQLQWHLFPATFHRLYVLFFVYIGCSGANATYSYWSWNTLGNWRNSIQVCILPQRLIALQISLLYVASALQKLVLPSWQTGEILQYALMSHYATPVAFWVANLGIPLTILTASIWWIVTFELLLVIGLWIRCTRMYAAIAGALFHVSIGIFFNIWSFLILIPLYYTFSSTKAK